VVAPFYDALTADDQGWTPNAVLAELIAPDIRPDMRALDAGAGTGQTVAVLLKSLPASQVVALDLSEGMLAVLAERFPGVRTFLGTVESLATSSSSATFDLVTAVGALEFVEDLGSFLRASHALLAPGGLLAFTYLPAIRFHKHQDQSAAEPAPGQRRASPFPFPREPGEVAAMLTATGFATLRDLELVAYREAGEPIIYHLILARR
jgi:predicted TPR repeat methyltransferase